MLSVALYNVIMIRSFDSSCITGNSARLALAKPTKLSKVRRSLYEEGRPLGNLIIES